MELKNVEKQEKSIVALTIAVSAEELENGKQAAFKKNGKKIAVPGFRKGKAPRQLIEKLYGDTVFFEDAINICYPEAYDKAVDEAKIVPVGRADIEMQDVPEEGGFVFVAKVPVEPEVSLGEYKGLEAEKEEAEVKADDVQAELNRMAQRVARTETVEREAKNGDAVTLDFDGYVDEKPFEGGKSEGYNLVLGSGTFIPGFEDQLVGVKAGESRDVQVTFPEDYHADELKGKQAIFKCTVHAVKETVLPEMDDEFAKDVSETCETLDSLKDEIKGKLTKAREEETDRDFEEKLIDNLLEKLEADVPDVMYETQTESILKDFAYRLQMQGMGLEQYMAMNGMDMPTFRGLFRDQAVRQVKTRLALQKIAELENLEISDEELEEEFGKMAENYGLEVDKVKKAVSAEALRGDLKLTKALDIVKGSAKVTMVSRQSKAAEVDGVDGILANEQ